MAFFLMIQLFSFLVVNTYLHVYNVNMQSSACLHLSACTVLWKSISFLLKFLFLYICFAFVECFRLNKSKPTAVKHLQLLGTTLHGSGGILSHFSLRIIGIQPCLRVFKHKIHVWFESSQDRSKTWLLFFHLGFIVCLFL